MQRFDVIVVGAGFAGLHMLWKLREMGLTARVIERGGDVGGTWYWNRYPGCRCDVPSLDYSVPWDAEIDQLWDWSERFATQPEVLTYVNALADRHDLRRDMQFDTAVNRLEWDDARKLWAAGTDRGDIYEARWVVSAAGALSEPNLPDYPGISEFQGEIYHTGRWPTEPVALAGKRVAVMGTGSTGIQAATAIAKQAGHLYVLQRTAQFSLPCFSPPLTDTDMSEMKARYPEHREWQRTSFNAASIGVAQNCGPRAFDDPKEQRFKNYEERWNSGTAALVGVYGDVSTNKDVAAELSDFVRDKIRGIVKDPATAEALCPKPGSYIGTRRIILDTGYFQIFNQPNVTLVDIGADPIAAFTANGVRLESGAEYEIDLLVNATGYDAVTGPLIAMNITGKGGVNLKDAWVDGPHTYLGLMVAGFPNLFTITGPSSPGVLANVIFSIDQHVNWIADCITHMRETGAVDVDTTVQAQDDWRAHAEETLAKTLRVHDDKNWYLGTNIPGKPRAVLIYQGGLGFYKERCDEIAADDYRGFVFGHAKETEAA